MLAIVRFRALAGSTATPARACICASPKKATPRRNGERQRRLGSRKVDGRPLNPLSIRAAAPMTRRWFPAALCAGERERKRERERVRSIPREYPRKVRTRDTRVRRKGNEEGLNGQGRVVVEKVGGGSPTPSRNTRRSPRYTRARVYANECARLCVCVGLSLYGCSADSTWRRGCPSRGTSR